MDDEERVERKRAAWREYARKKRAEDPAAWNKSVNDWRAAHPDRVANWPSMSPERRKEYSRKFRRENPDVCRDAQYKWRKKNPAAMPSIDKALRNRRIDSGTCAACGKVPRREGHRNCAECAEKLVRLVRKRQIDLVDQGLCKSCGKAPCLMATGVTMGTLCTTCYLKRLAWHHLGSATHWQSLRDKFEQQNGRCAYTGVELSLCGNASVDHIYPRSRYPELSRSPTNIQWVDKRINSLKGNRTPEEFEAIIESIHHVITSRQQPIH